MAFAKPFCVSIVAFVLLSPLAEAKLEIPPLSTLSKLASETLVSSFHNTEAAFVEFLKLHGRNYTGAQFLYRLRVFESNLLMAVENQLNDPTAVHGITRFFDLTEEEFAQHYLGLKTPKGFTDHPIAPLLPTNDLPVEFDWRTKGAVTPIKNQGSCGSCYAFSAVGAIEGAHFLKTGKLVSLSEQQVVDCDHQCDPSYYDVCDSGCMGGLMNNVINYVMEAGGLQTEADYPYKGVDGTCNFDSKNSKVAASVSSYQVVDKDELQIAANLVKYGPLAVAINAAWMQTYVRGVSCPIVCNKRALNHGVLLVGYGASDYSPARLKQKPYWIIKNSWGPTWGEAGYYEVCSGRSTCGMNSMVSSVVATTLETVDQEHPLIQEQ